MEGVSAGARIRIGCALGDHKMQSASARRRCTAEQGVDSANRQLVIRRAAASRVHVGPVYNACRATSTGHPPSLVLEKVDVSDRPGPDVSRDPSPFETRCHNRSRKSFRCMS